MTRFLPRSSRRLGLRLFAFSGRLGMFLLGLLLCVSGLSVLLGVGLLSGLVFVGISRVKPKCHGRILMSAADPMRK
jgi:hypothetical protein